MLVNENRIEKSMSKPSPIDHYSKRLVTLITSSLHEVCGVWRPVGPVSGSHGQRFVPQLSAEGVLEAAQDKHHSLHDAIERHRFYRLGFRFGFGFWFGLWLGFWTLSLVWCLLGWRSCKIISTIRIQSQISSVSQQWMLCSEWVPSEWESKQLIKHHNNPHHSSPSVNIWRRQKLKQIQH